MKNKSYGKSAIIALFAVILMAGTLSSGSAFAQPAPTATGNATASEPLTVTIFSKTTNTDYVYDNIMSEQDLLNAIQEVETLTHPELASAPGGMETLSADQSDQQLATGIFSLANQIPGEEAGTETEAAGIVAAAPWILKGAELGWKHKDTVISVTKKVGGWLKSLW